MATIDCTIQGRGYVDTYTFSGTAGQRIAVSMNSSAFDTYLYLINPTNQTVAEDDDGGGETNSRIPITSGFLTLPATGTYSIYATSFDANRTGAYSISLTSESGGQCPTTSINFGQTINGSLTTSDCVFSGTTRYVDIYTFSGTAGQQISVSMNSTVVNSYLYLLNASNQILAENDNGGGGVNSRIPAASGFFTLPATGNYTIFASSLNANENGVYTLALTQQSCSYSLNQTSQSFPAAGGNGTVNVTAGTGCIWNVSNNVSWITASINGNGTGNGAVNISVAANTGADRSGTFTVAGQTFTVNQTGISTLRRTGFDFDGDGKADVSVFRPSNGAWYLQQSTAGFTGLQFGVSTDRIVPADYDGDGKTDVAVYRGGTWYLQRSRDGFTGVAFGDANDIPVPADYDGDGKADLAVFRPSNGVWYLLRSNLGFTGIQFGQTSDKPVASDYDGDGKSDIAVSRNGIWYILRSQLGFTGIAFGDGNDKLVPADYDGDGKSDVAVFRPSNGVWYLQQSTAGFTGIAFGLGTDLPVAADYDGDGKADLAVFRNGTWYLNRSTAGFTGVAFGAATDRPIPNAFVQ